MIRFDVLEKAGLSVAAMSDRQDGNCGGSVAGLSGSQRLLGELSIEAHRFRRLRQVHGIHIITADEQPREGAAPSPEGDGLVCATPGVALGIGVADCAPVLIFDPVRRVLAALHAGREGTRLAIAERGVSFLHEQYESEPRNLLALIGPCAGPCCYEVSPVLAAAWRAADLPARGRYLDIAGANRRQLEIAGVIRHNIHVVSHCTVCSGVFFSYRADRTSERNLVVVML